MKDQMNEVRVLVVDDNSDIREFLVALLEEEYKVQAVANGWEALVAAVKEGYDVALIDLEMPGMSGDEVARRLRKECPAIGTVLMTGSKMQDSDPRMGNFDFRFSKPFPGPGTIKKTVARAKKAHDARVLVLNTTSAESSSWGSLSA